VNLGASESVGIRVRRGKVRWSYWNYSILGQFPRTRPAGCGPDLDWAARLQCNRWIIER